jgi:hypothetical protein
VAEADSQEAEIGALDPECLEMLRPPAPRPSSRRVCRARALARLGTRSLPHHAHTGPDRPAEKTGEELVAEADSQEAEIGALDPECLEKGVETDQVFVVSEQGGRIPTVQDFDRFDGLLITGSVSGQRSRAPSTCLGEACRSRGP